MLGTRGSPFGSPRELAGCCDKLTRALNWGVTFDVHDLPTTQLGCVYALTFWRAETKTEERNNSLRNVYPSNRRVPRPAQNFLF